MKKNKEYKYEEPAQDVLDAVKKAAVEGRLDCPRAWAIARQLNVPVPVVGRAADLLGIKIKNCALGCF
ncbi:hypothetical protein ACP3TJ_04560 [Desulforudis sp. 1088]|uniref:hypothetical protein n=1 Tax=unclassified Candidatus Desulforudis TaxID=2635950 RepID=UPI00347035C6